VITKTVLCYGDSNTHGTPDVDGPRLPFTSRWTGLLQQCLGAGYRVIEEGLGGRTTDLDYENRIGRNGRTYFMPCVESHNPLDVIIIMLGTNDIKTEFGRSAQETATALHGYLDDLEQVAFPRPGVILLSPILIDPAMAGFATENLPTYGADSPEKSRGFAPHMREVAAARSVGFLDAATVASPGYDGIHLSQESHPALAELIASTIR
jgi:lysophospholipase L1-like esterase